MDAEAIQEIANQLGITVDAVTKEVIPAYASYAITAHVSRVIVFAAITIALLVLARFFIAKSKEYANWEQEKLTKYQRSDMRDKYETFATLGFICYGSSSFTAVISVVELATMIPWIVSPYGAFVHLLMPH